MAFLENVGALLVLIGIMILIHELGHYWAARIFDVHVEAFSIGFGPRLFGFRRASKYRPAVANGAELTAEFRRNFETDFKVSAIPFGGYVKMLGEQPGEDPVTDPRAFHMKPRWQRLIIAAAGPAMNIVLAVALLTGIFMVRYPKALAGDGPATIGHIVADSPAAEAGLKEGDVIVRLDDKENPNWEDIAIKEISSANTAVSVIVHRKAEKGTETERFVVTPRLDSRTGYGFAGWSEENETLVGGVSSGMGAEKAGLQKGDVIVAVNGVPLHSTVKLHELVRASGGTPIEIVYSRNGERSKVTVQPSFNKDDTPEGRWMIGVRLEPKFVVTQLPFGEALNESVKQNVRSAGLIFQFLKGIVEQKMSPKSLEGPIRIGQLSGEAAREGPIAFISLMAMVSLNLAVFNLLPIPILDGGVILMLLIEMLMGRDMSLRVKETVLKFGFVFLMAVVAFVLYNDISKILPS